MAQKNKPNVTYCEICETEMKDYLASIIPRTRYTDRVDTRRVKSHIVLCQKCFSENQRAEELEDLKRARKR